MKRKTIILSFLIIWVPIALSTAFRYQSKPFKSDLTAEINQIIENAKGGTELQNSLLEVEALRVNRNDATGNFWLQLNGDRNPDFIQFHESKLMETSSYLVYSAVVKPTGYRLLKHTLKGTVLIDIENQVIAHQIYTKHDWF